MGTSRREYIMQNMQTTIRKVKHANDYDNDIPDSRVFRAEASVDPKAFPACYLFEGDEVTVEREYMGANTRVTKEFEIICEVWVASRKDLATAINSIERDVVAAVMEDNTRGGYAINTASEGSSPFFYDDKTGGRIISFTVTYTHRETDPNLT